MNPSYEYMSRTRDEKHAELLSCERFAVARRLRALELPESGSHDMLARVAYAVYPHAGPWDREAVRGLVERLVRLVGKGREDDCCRGAGAAGARDERHGRETLTYDVLGNEGHMPGPDGTWMVSERAVLELLAMPTPSTRTTSAGRGDAIADYSALSSDLCPRFIPGVAEG